ncbi:heme oxygenase (biliverdin-producing) [Streptomyces sp. NPDC048419]|uniref:biliverdin-producing heme oxygenase n=1 Tax=Streptomyces sp. NPDC048419 TaxID=3365547 RepID=UPI00371A5161
MIRSRGPAPAGARYTEQLWFVYEALESGAEHLASDPVAGPFIQPQLYRLAALERDLEHLRGPGRPSGLSALPPTREYAARERKCAERGPAGYVAHHYTRYLGDLSGGQIIRGTAEETWGFARRATASASTSSSGSPTRPHSSAVTYRELLDAVPADDLEEQHVLTECKRAFALNTEVFRALGEEFTLSA